ncbi:GDSL-type esterase/lipase family protein [Lachnospiraceae bacterium 46-15]
MKTFLFLGDSITDSHRLWQPENNGLGNGYVKILSDIAMKKSFPDIYINKGHDGFTLPALYRNLPTDCYPCHPDFVTILIGINDIAAARNSNLSFEPETFALQYDELLNQVLAHTRAKLLCMAPFIFPHPQEFSLWIPDIIQAEKAISDLTEKYSLPFVPLHNYLNDAASKKGYSKITLDGIHLTPLGHRLIALRWLKTVTKYFSQE